MTSSPSFLHAKTCKFVCGRSKVTFEAASTPDKSCTDGQHSGRFVTNLFLPLCNLFTHSVQETAKPEAVMLRWVLRYAGCSSPITCPRATRWSCGVSLSAAATVGISASALSTFWRVGRSASAAVVSVGALCHIAVSSYVQISARPRLLVEISTSWDSTRLILKVGIESKGFIFNTEMNCYQCYHFGRTNIFVFRIKMYWKFKLQIAILLSKDLLLIF